MKQDTFDQMMSGVKNKLDVVSPSFCVAKWKQVTIHLTNGQTHSCHHPGTHHIPVEELVNNPSALHNTNFKKSLRKEMLEGKRPKECDYCWRVEDSPGEHFSDRVRKSADSWAIDHLDDVAKMPWDENVFPSYVEVNFSSACNFKCSYCYPHISSSIMADTLQHGPIKLSGENRVDRDIDYLKGIGMIPIPNREHNPYIEAWWKWWPSLYPNLHTFRITGGEPLLSKETWKTLEWIKNNPHPKLNLAFNTNLGVDQELIDKFLTECNELVKNNCVNEIQIFTSCDTFGKQAEYIRPGLDYSKWYYNLWNIAIRYPNLKCTVMCTFNILSLPGFKNFLSDMLALRRSAISVMGNTETPKYQRIVLDIPYLRHPYYLAVSVGGKEQIAMMEDIVRWAEEKPLSYVEKDRSEHYYGFFPSELNSLKRILSVMKNEGGNTENNITHRKDLYLFIKQHDQRNGFLFEKVFPELVNFRNECENGIIEYD